MTTLPTYAECAAVPPEKRTALERFIHAWTPDDVGYEYPGFDWRDQLTAVIEEERKERDALREQIAEMVRKAADKSLEGYRELGRRAAAAANERDALAARIAEQDAQIESLQNKWATRPLSIQDCDALEAENERLREALRQIADDGIERSRDPRTLIALAALAKEPTP